MPRNDTGLSVPRPVYPRGPPYVRTCAEVCIPIDVKGFFFSKTRVFFGRLELSANATET